MSTLFNPNEPNNLAAAIAKTGLKLEGILRQTLKFAVPASRSSTEKDSIHGSESQAPKTP